jgi:hypothetical protein
MRSAATRQRCGAVERNPPQEGSDASGELHDREGFAQIIVGSHLQPGDAVGHVTAGGEHEDRHQVLAPELAADGEPVQAGQHPVEDYEIGAGAVRGCERLPAIEGLLDPVPFLFQMGAHQVR